MFYTLVLQLICLINCLHFKSEKAYEVKELSQANSQQDSTQRCLTGRLKLYCSILTLNNR